MLVGQRMSHPVITVSPDTPIQEALKLMRSQNISRTPVVENGKMIGIVTENDLLNASPSKATTLSIWEINYLLSKVTVREVMTKKVYTIEEDCPIEEAACRMADKDISGLPVVRNGEVVGIITEHDLFKIFIEMMGARQPGLRVSVLLPNQPGEIAKLSRVIYENGGDIIGLGSFAGESISNFMVTVKVGGISEKKIRSVLEPIAIRIVDIRKA
jgi:acetoin utilization protein AcuB